MTDQSAGGAPGGAAPPAPRVGFRDPTDLTRWLTLLLWASAAVAAVDLVSSLFQLDLLDRIKDGATVEPAAADAGDVRQGLIAIASVIVAITTTVVFAMWIYRANDNARRLGAAGMQFTPGWAVGWYFIPIANLFKPYQAMKEIWQASADPVHWPDVPRGALLPWWWFFFLVSNAFDNAAGRLSFAAKSVSDLLAGSAIEIASDALDVIAAFVALALVREIYRMQMALRPAPLAAT